LAATSKQVQQHGVVCHQPDTLASHRNDKPNHTTECKKDDLVPLKLLKLLAGLSKLSSWRREDTLASHSDDKPNHTTDYKRDDLVKVAWLGFSKLSK